MKLKAILFVFFLWIPLETHTQNTILWEIAHPNHEFKSYLIGTFHQLGNSFVDSLPVITELLYNSDMAFFETIDDTDSLRAMLNKRPDAFLYKEKLKKNDVKFLETYAESWSVRISKLTPIELYIKLSQEYILHCCGTAKPSDKWHHFDKYLIHLAKEKNITIQGLETDSIQTQGINKMAEAYDWSIARNDISYFVQNIKKSKTDTYQCKQAMNYLNFNFDYKFDQDCDSSDMIERNKKWMPVILENLDHQQLFVAVGLEHLYGQCGLIKTLRRHGYDVNPVEIQTVRH